MSRKERVVLSEKEQCFMNLFCVVGQVAEIPTLKETVSGIKVANVLLKVQRPFANSEGVYEFDLIPVELWRGIAETLCNVASEGHGSVQKVEFRQDPMKRWADFP